MRGILDRTRALESSLASMKELLLGNVVLLGEVPSYAGTWQSDDEMSSVDYSVRARFFADRMSELGVDECTTDPLGNPIGIIKGGEPGRPPILVCAELDSLFNPPGDIHYAIDGDTIVGPGMMDNAIGAAAVMSLPDVLKREGISFRSTVMLAGIANTMRDSKNLALVDRFLDSLGTRPSAAIIVKGGELGRLNYFSEAVVRADILCERRPGARQAPPNMIIVANEIIDRLLELELPQKPETAVTVGMIRGGYKYGTPATTARVGIELRSTSNEALSALTNRIAGILDQVRHERRVDIEYDVAAALGAASLGWSHPLTSAAIAVIQELGLELNVYPSVSELYYFLQRGIPAVTIGVATGSDYHQELASASLRSLYSGMAQLIGVMLAADEEAADA
ncbi:MAG: peptidase dimerization domain-containing protein [Spirochaetaceae bacterium]|nr:peptidase dimerization domain-containing protein [Spirochaetaceae bacterium]